MEISVADVDALPANTYISVRYGDMRRQAAFRAGEVLTFPKPAPGEKAPKAYTVDVLRKVGSKQVSLAGITALGGTITSENLEIPSLEISGSPIMASLTASLNQGGNGPASPESSKKAQVALRAKQYLEKHSMQNMLHEMFAQLLEKLPGDPLAFLVDFLEQRREEAEEQEHEQEIGLPSYAEEPGLGAAPLQGFADGTVAEDLPDLSHHHSIMADVLRKEPSLYTSLCGSTTALGVTLAQCIKPGVDCPGHELVKVAGAFAGDEECYEAYHDIFEPIISGLHSGWIGNAFHAMDSDPAKLTNSRIDPTGRYAVYASMEARRNLSGLRFPTCCSKEERRKVEGILTKMLVADSGIKGTYYPLRGSESFRGKVGGMTAHQEKQLRGVGMLFSEPDSRMRLSAGLGRDWPDSRGVLVGEIEGLYVWCNEEDHLRFFARQHTVDLKKLWARLDSTMGTVLASAQGGGHGYSWTERLGYSTACPSRLGAAMRISVSLKVPLLAAATDLAALCRSMDVQSSQEVNSTTHGSIWNVSTGDCLGVSEVDLVNIMIEACGTLVELEQRLERGEPIYDAMPGLGPEATPGFPVDRCPNRMPDMLNNHTMMASVLMQDPAIYKELRSRQTSMGVALAPCIKPGIDGKGSPVLLTAGLVAGDQESYAKFRELFDPVIAGLNAGFLAESVHPSDVGLSKIGEFPLDVISSAVVSVRIEFRRNLQGLRLAPCMSAAERREVERLLVKGMTAINDDYGGDYMPLACSHSYAKRLGGVAWAEQARLCSSGLLFAEPSQPVRLAAGLGRDWPDARGAFLAEEKGLAIWCNEEEHLRFISTQEGGSIKAAFGRALDCVHRLEAEIKAEGYHYMHDSRLGYLTVDPIHLGNGLRCSVSLRLPRLSAHQEFSRTCAALRLEATWRAGAWDLASGPSLGVSEVELVNTVVQSCVQLAQLEQKLEQGVAIDSELRAMSL